MVDRWLTLVYKTKPHELDSCQFVAMGGYWCQGFIMRDHSCPSMIIRGHACHESVKTP